MRVRALLTVLGALTLLVAACGDDDDQGAAPGETSTSTTTTESTTTTAPAPSGPEVRISVQVPEDLAGDFTAASTDQFSWLTELYGMESESSVGFLGVGASPEPATLADPEISITGNQALAAARGIAGEVLGYVDAEQVLVNEETTLNSGRPAWHVRLRVGGSDMVTEIDVIGLEDAGSFQYAVAVTRGLREDTVTQLHDAVAAASMT